jgi:hypothetical protein
MSKKQENQTAFKGLTVNERLLISGQLDKFDKAARTGNRKKMISLLQNVDLTKNSAKSWVDTLLGDQKFFYY